LSVSSESWKRSKKPIKEKLAEVSVIPDFFVKFEIGVYQNFRILWAGSYRLNPAHHGKSGQGGGQIPGACVIV
jgi:hypothetical protein